MPIQHLSHDSYRILDHFVTLLVSRFFHEQNSVSCENLPFSLTYSELEEANFVSDYRQYLSQEFEVCEFGGSKSSRKEWLVVRPVNLRCNDVRPVRRIELTRSFGGSFCLKFADGTRYLAKGNTRRLLKRKAPQQQNEYCQPLSSLALDLEGSERDDKENVLGPSSAHDVASLVSTGVLATAKSGENSQKCSLRVQLKGNPLSSLSVE